MKQLHRPDLFNWSVFNEDRNIDFHGICWVRPEGNVVIDPLPMSDHDRQHLQSLGGAKHIVITNSDHTRDAERLVSETGAELLGPQAEQADFPFACQRWLGEGDEVVPGLEVFAVSGSKTSGELALLLEKTTLITGDLIRAHEGGRLCLLPDSKLCDRPQAVASVQRLAALPDLEAVLPGDGWPIFC
ncbi:MAG: MBL fold metallo-hydrolase, partial [SAR324 cluster bacterium]|nr:MBL fold metallo-hydrolase [SAR324 cluster bacterium]